MHSSLEEAVCDFIANPESPLIVEYGSPELCDEYVLKPTGIKRILEVEGSNSNFRVEFPVGEAYRTVLGVLTADKMWTRLIHNTNILYKRSRK